MVDGIKGLFWFVGFLSYDIIKGIVIDYMYGFCFGVMKMMMNFWFVLENFNKLFSISELVLKVDKRLFEIYFFFEIGRILRFIEYYRKYWKVFELRFFFFYYGMLVLFGILGVNYFYYFVIFS